VLLHSSSVLVRFPSLVEKLRRKDQGERRNASTLRYICIFFSHVLINRSLIFSHEYNLYLIHKCSYLIYSIIDQDISKWICDFITLDRICRLVLFVTCVQVAGWRILELELRDYTSWGHTRTNFKENVCLSILSLHKIGNILFGSRENHRSLSHCLSRINGKILGRSYYPHWWYFLHKIYVMQ